MDRITPTKRPAKKPAGTQKWRDLLFVHWTFPSEVLRPLVPAALDLDPWDGEMYVGLVPFEMKDIRTSWMPSGTGLDFLETNVRTYVSYQGRPGVFFFSLEASSWLAVKAARVGWGLPYFHASMASAREGDSFTYRSDRKGGGAKLDAKWTLGEKLPVSAPESLEFFLLERYLLFSERGGRIYEGQVHHVPYPAQRAELVACDESLLAAAGLPAPGAPKTVHFASGVDVEVFGPWPT